MRRYLSRALIIANGDVPTTRRVKSLASSCGMVVCADGGANHARRMRIVPDVILGDLDSMTAATRGHFMGVPVLFLEDQESTDLEKAIRFCIERRIRHV